MSEQNIRYFMILYQNRNYDVNETKRNESDAYIDVGVFSKYMHIVTAYV